MPKTESLNEILDSDCCRLLLKQPFVANVLLSLKLEVNNDFDTAATDGETIYINEQFYRSLEPDERIFVLAHETWHVILLHFARRQDRDLDLFNIAADLEIHFQLASADFSEPFVLPHDPCWAPLSAEEIYDWIKKQPEWQEYYQRDHTHGPSGGKGGSRRKRSSRSVWQRRNGEGFDEHIYVTAAKIRENCDKVRGILHRAMARTRFSIGNLPGGVQVLLKNFLKPQVNWKTELKQFVTQCFGGSRRWLPPARRYVSQGLYLPSRRDALLNAVVAIDTSGSTGGYLPAFFTELKSLFHSFGNYEITVIQCDTDIQKVEKFTGNIPETFQASGLGGTSFVPPFEYVRKNRLTPSVFIYITDGLGTVPQNSPPYPVLWLLTPYGEEKSLPWGRVIRMKDQKGND
ncbi:MAG: hypothetical protein IJS14_02265 [Lentisphaeria bacterium]|nr:hypothetical protein [Lentisphaeria bacterium]